MLQIKAWAEAHAYRDALFCTELWLGKDPANRDLRFMRIRLHAWNNDFTKANRWLANEQDQDAESFALRGEIAFLQKDWPRAAPHFEQAMKLAPRNSELYQQSRKRWLQLQKSPVFRPQLISGVQLLRARESQDWTETGLAGQVNLRLKPNLLLGVDGKTRTRSTSKIAYSDSAYGISGFYQWNPAWGLQLSFAHATKKLIYPGSSFDATAYWVWSEPLTFDFGIERRAYANDVTINLLHGGGAYETTRLRYALHAYLGFGTSSSSTIAALIRTRSKPWAMEVYGSTGREESSRPYLQAGETIQGFYVIGAAGLWESSSARWRLRFGCERREERAFWHHGCELGAGLTL